MYRQEKGIVYCILMGSVLLLALYAAIHGVRNAAGEALGAEAGDEVASVLRQPVENDGVPMLFYYTSAQYGGLGTSFGTYTMTVSIYASDDEAEEPLWSETIGDVEVNRGNFSVLLGQTETLSPTLFSEPTRFIGRSAQRSGDGTAIDEMRMPLASVPYAFKADSAKLARTAGRATRADFATELWTPDFQQQAIIVSGDGGVAVGSEPPEAQLHIQGDGKIDGNLTVSGTINGADVQMLLDRIAALEEEVNNLKNDVNGQRNELSDLTTMAANQDTVLNTLNSTVSSHGSTLADLKNHGHEGALSCPQRLPDVLWFGALYPACELPIIELPEIFELLPGIQELDPSIFEPNR